MSRKFTDVVSYLDPNFLSKLEFNTSSLVPKIASH